MTKEEIKFLKEFLPEHTHDETIEEFHKRFPDTPFDKSKSWTFSKNHDLHKGYDNRYKKGNIPHNKGKKIEEFMSAEGIEKSKATRFKKGHMPVQYKAKGSIRKDADGYYRIKVDNHKKWKLLHCLIWEQNHNQKIPENHVVVFLDGNTSNMDINNLKLISRKELMILNSKGWKTEYPEITDAYINLLKLMEEKWRLTDEKSNAKSKRKQN